MLIKGYTDYDAATKTGLGGTKICFDALTNDQIDFYPEYTAERDCWPYCSRQQKTVDSLTGNKDATYQLCAGGVRKKYNVTWLKPIGFNNAYALMMREKQAKDLKIKTISDLKRYLESK